MEKNILLIDDLESMRGIIKFPLIYSDYKVTDVAHAKTALDLLRKNTFQLIITDLEMPDINGIEFTKTIRANNHYHHKFTPILMITTASKEQYRIEAIEAGITGFLTKPFTHEELLKVVKKLIG